MPLQKSDDRIFSDWVEEGGENDATQELHVNGIRLGRVVGQSKYPIVSSVLLRWRKRHADWIVWVSERVGGACGCGCT